METSLQDCVGSTSEIEKRYLEGRILTSIQKIDSFLLKQQTFHLAFFSLGLALLFGFFCSLLLHQRPMISAFLIWAFVLTTFSYLILRVYIKLHLPEELMKTFRWYQEQCKEELKDHIETSISSVLSEVLLSLIDEIGLHFKKRSSSFLFNLLHWKTAISLLELLYSASIKQRIQSIWEGPSSAQHHARFGFLLTKYADLYAMPSKTHIWNDRYYRQVAQKREDLLKRALEEYLISIKLRPGQGELYLAISKIFDELGDREAKIEAFEKYQLHFNDEMDILFELGTLYFENGKILKGLEILEELKSRNESLALELWQRAKSYSLKCELFSNPEF